MRRLQDSPWFKGTAALLLLAFACLGGLFGTFVLRGLLCQGADSWQETFRFQNLLREREAAVASLMADSLALGRLPLGEYTDGEQWSHWVELRESQGEADGGIWPDEALSYVQSRQYEQSIASLAALLDPEQTWFRFQVRTADGLWTLGGNLAPGQEMEQTVDGVYYASFGLGEYWVEDSGAQLWEEAASEETPGGSTGLVVECGVAREMSDTVQDGFYALLTDYAGERANFESNVTGLVVFLSLAGLCMAALLWTGGHRRGVQGAAITWQEKIFFDVYLLAMAAAWVGLAVVAVQSGENLIWLWSGEGADSSLDQVAVNLYTALFCGAAAGMAAAVALTLRTLAVRVKAGALGRTTLLVRVATWMVRTIHDFLLGLPLTWKAVLSFAAYALCSAFLLLNAWYSGLFMALWLLFNLAAMVYLSWWALGCSRLRRGARIIASGALDHQIDTARLPHDLRLQAEDLNNISVGLAGAVDEKMKSERFKAELITNVSHDLKTPLTSIINYVTLLKSTQQTDAKAREYIVVLDRKSQRLKKHTEDLVAASKASTGVLSVNRERIGMAQLVDQALGEWEEKLRDRNLTLVTGLPEGETWVYADGRHLWRVMDNLLSNCAKYAMEGTRIYLDLKRGKGQVSLSVKNISREALNIPPERLMERFVRGEESRSTEGSGLGLSIARSLTELQGGVFELSVDGDLFKATVTLPQAN